MATQFYDQVVEELGDPASWNQNDYSIDAFLARHPRTHDNEWPRTLDIPDTEKLSVIPLKAPTAEEQEAEQLLKKSADELTVEDIEKIGKDSLRKHHPTLAAELEAEQTTGPKKKTPAPKKGRE